MTELRQCSECPRLFRGTGNCCSDRCRDIRIAKFWRRVRDRNYYRELRYMTPQSTLGEPRNALARAHPSRRSVGQKDGDEYGWREGA
jgi:hypothetical protein